MAQSLTHKIIAAHVAEGEMIPGREIGLRVDQVLIQDATGTMVWQQFATFGVPRVRVPRCCTYVDHNILQTGFENPDDHLFLQTMCAKYGATFSRAGNGISHFAHLERFDCPGQVMVGSDSHTCQAGALAMVAIGAGGAEVAAAMAGFPFYVKMPKVVNVRLTGTLPPWVAAKDIILEVLRRLTVKGGLGKVLEYTGPGLAGLSVYERSTIANMGQETGATGTVFPSDDQTKRFLRAQGREADWKEMQADADARYDECVEIDLAMLEPLVAKPHSPDNVVPVRELVGLAVRQVAVGSSVNSSYRDLMTVAKILKGKHIAPNLHMTLSPGSRQILLNLTKDGAVLDLTMAGVRELEVACGPCIGMGAAPPSLGPSLRTFNRNFPGRSGTPTDEVYLCSPEVAAAAAIKGAIADPRELGDPPVITEPKRYLQYRLGFIEPPPDGEGVEVYIGPNIKPMPDVPPLEDTFSAEVLLTLGDNVSTDEILPAGAKVLPLRSNIPAISEYTFTYVDETFAARARAAGKGIVVGGENYGQGSSREHAAIAPMFLGVRAVIATSYARIHESNLVNYGILPLRFTNPADFVMMAKGDRLQIDGIKKALSTQGPITVKNLTKNTACQTTYVLSDRQIAILLAGGISRWVKKKA